MTCFAFGLPITALAAASPRRTVTICGRRMSGREERPRGRKGVRDTVALRQRGTTESPFVRLMLVCRRTRGQHVVDEDQEALVGDLGVGVEEHSADVLHAHLDVQSRDVPLQDVQHTTTTTKGCVYSCMEAVLTVQMGCLTLSSMALAP